MLQPSLDDESLVEELRQRLEERRRKDADMRALEEQMDKLKFDKDKAAQEAAELREQVAHHQSVPGPFPEGMAIDLLFLLDITSSMRAYRDAVVKQLSVIIAHLKGTYKLALDNIRVGVVGYRDFNLIPRFEMLPLQPVSGNGAQAIEKWLSALEFRSVRTGDVKNDFPEDVHGGLEKAAGAEMGWKSPARSIVHIADAPGHGRRLRDADARWKDHLLDHDEDGTQLRALLTALRAQVKVQSYLFMHVRSKSDGRYFTQAMVRQFAKDCGDPTWIREVQWLEDKMMGLEVVSTVLESMQRSLSSFMAIGAQRAVDHHDSDRDIVTIKEQPNWGEIKALPFRMACHDPKLGEQSIRDLMDMINLGKHLSLYEAKVGDKAVIKIAPHPFDKDKRRVAHYARFYPDGEEHPSTSSMRVVKEFIREEDNEFACFKEQLETHAVARFMAEKFNSHAKQLSLDSTMQVPEVKYASCYLIDLAVTGLNSTQRFYLMEHLLPGDITRFNDNNGFVNEKDPQPHLQAFSHWTYEVTDGQLMVVDVKGFKTLGNNGNQEIILVDPAIHCTRGGYFGHTNRADMGGFRTFLESHQHGAICERMLGQDGRSECVHFRDREHEARSANARDGPMSESIRRRFDAVKEAIKGHARCRELLRTRGLRCPDYFYEAIEVCEVQRVLVQGEAATLRALNAAANKAKHDWNKPGEALRQYQTSRSPSPPRRSSPNRRRR